MRTRNNIVNQPSYADCRTLTPRLSRFTGAILMLVIEQHGVWMNGYGSPPCTASPRPAPVMTGKLIIGGAGIVTALR
ncbi:hypothetical protein E2C01_033279 [Portunus trituberculatus]|uniref:Uncharacterized protein n=1 Tax=Portunus trituberculatus TaxID=210409 RepID=A0A5B7EYA5_PORTR|nr:hypothetical protein [Portunus trituberculatus]